LLVQLRPAFQQSLLTPRELSRQYFNCINCQHDLRSLIDCVQVWSMVASAALGIHSDDNAEESR
jgi:hypothetical protein